jgi:Ca-activated chloride channel homolog
VTIDAQVATTRVDQVFVNEADFPVEGTYIFPLPEDAAVTSFDMWVDGKKYEGKLLTREEARRIYEDIVRQQKDPALLEYVGRGAFQASIFPIPPRGERRIELSYSQVLKLENGLVHYRYPLNTEKFSSRDIPDVAVNVQISERAPVRTVYSPSHPVQVVREGERRAKVGYEAAQVRPDRDFDVYYSLSPDAIAVNLLSYKPFDEDGYFLLLVTPPVEAAGKAVDKDVILVLDTSGSMAGAKIDQAKNAARYVLEQLQAGDRFNIVSFSTATRLLAAEPISQSRVRDGQSFIDRITAEGSTDINRALLEALAGADASRPTVLIFLTDGLPTAGETNPDRIIANVAANAPKTVRLFSFGVGYDVDTVLLDALSSKQRGTSSYVKPEQDIKEEVSGFFAKVSAPVLVDIAAAFTGVRIEDLYPYPLPDLFAGTQLAVLGRYTGSGIGSLKLSGEVQGAGDALAAKTYHYAGLSFVSRGGNELIARLWAQRKVGYLLQQIRVQGESRELVDEVIGLATRFGIATPYTSFLVEEPAAGVAPTPQVFGLPSPGGAGDRRGGPAAAPTALEARSGAAAVQKAQEAAGLRESDAVQGAGAETVRHVGDKTFVLKDGVWTDTAFDPAKMKAETIKFGSDRYFRLLTDTPAIGRYLALGDKVMIVIHGKAYSIAP